MTQGPYSVAPQQHSPRDRATLITFLIILLLVLGFALRMERSYLMAILMGGILAILVDRNYQALRKRGVRPSLASLIVTSGIVILVLAPLAAFVLLAVRQGVAFGKQLADTNLLSLQSITGMVNRWHPVQFWIGDPAAVDLKIRTGIQNAAKVTSGAVLGLAADLPSMLLQVFLVCLTCYFMLIDGKRFAAWVANKLPIDPDVRARLSASFRNTAASVILASIVSAAVQAALMLVSFLVLGIPLAFFAAGATFILAWIPIVGSAPVWIAATIYTYFHDSGARAAIMLVFGLIIGVSDNFVRPWVLGGRSNLHPLVTLVAIFGGLEMFGFVGVFVGPILMAVLISLLQVWPDVAERYGLILAPQPEEVRPIQRRTASNSSTGASSNSA